MQNLVQNKDVEGVMALLKAERSSNTEGSQALVRLIDNADEVTKSCDGRTDADALANVQNVHGALDARTATLVLGKDTFPTESQAAAFRWARLHRIHKDQAAQSVLK